ncbi:GNAT family N-acetyltransferase [Rhodococcus rhodochrous]|uniref:GNAT family N-acetyltransferase n=1 Tax=Rhodococcus rhodochrous TaxID=1829 RepID=UPI0012FD82B9|nr:GNAT family N-acetyltransferase [Rhodococcus rhodochrous]
MEIRKVDKEDAPMLFEWRNDPVTRANSFSTGSVDWEEHVKWLDQTIKREDRHLYIVQVEGVSIGTFRLDKLDSQRAEISITVAPSARRKGYGSKILQEAAKVAGRLGYSSILAKVKEENTISKRMFLKAGYKGSSTVLELTL